jgi:murein tripeptide amidase MpaA
LRDTAAEFPTICTLINIGQSFEGRDLFVLKISSGAGKPGIWIDANIHAREWITNAIGTYTINELLRSTDPETRRLTEDFDWYIMPMMNPDGYEYSRNTDRMWRKTRSTTTSPLGCRGADPNRNWGYTWNQGGSSPNPCTDTFMGATAFSEPENAAANTYFATIAGQVKFYLSLHSYSQLILLPYGHNNNRIPQYNEWMRIGNLAAAAFRQRFGTNFRVGNIVDLLYVASGGSMDHVLGTHGTALTYTFEMRDTGSYGFLLPPAQIVPSCLEFMDALHAIVNEVRQMN